MKEFKLAQGKKLIGVYRGTGPLDASGVSRSILVDRVNGFRVTTLSIDAKDTGECMLTYKLREVPIGSIILLKRQKDRVLGPSPVSARRQSFVST